MVEFQTQEIKTRWGDKMNTNEVAKTLGVSSSTVKRWVKQLSIDPARNSKGHFIFTKEEFSQLEQYHTQDQFHSIQTMPIPNNEEFEKLKLKVNELELKLYKKADGVASIQLLQHRNELEELLTIVNELTSRIDHLETQMSKTKKPPAVTKPLALDTLQTTRKRKRKITKLMFGF